MSKIAAAEQAPMIMFLLDVEDGSVTGGEYSVIKVIEGMSKRIAELSAVCTPSYPKQQITRHMNTFVRASPSKKQAHSEHFPSLILSLSVYLPNL
jgi:hypothetical protein